jgi:hypothetical protein
MALYERIWRLLAGAVAAGGVVLEVLTHPPSTLIALAAVSMGVSLCVGLGMRVGEPGAVPARTTAAQAIRAALLGAVALTALVGLASLGRLTMIFVAVVVVATSPVFATRVLGLNLASVDRSEEGGAETWRFSGPVQIAQRASIDVARLASADVRAMDTRDLVRNWRRSFVALEQTGDPATKMALVQARQAFLDELERRNPAGLHEWLESGARAAGDPTRFMSSGDEREQGGPQAA